MPKRRVTLSLGPRALKSFECEAERREMPLPAYLSTLLQELALQGNVSLTVLPSKSAAPLKAAEQPKGTPRYRGVYRYGKRWAAVLWVNGAQRRVGVFDDPEEASKVYERARAAFENSGSDSGQTLDVNNPSTYFLEKLGRGERLSDEEWDVWTGLDRPGGGALRIIPVGDMDSEGAPIATLPITGDAEIDEEPLVDADEEMNRPIYVRPDE